MKQKTIRNYLLAGLVSALPLSFNNYANASIKINEIVTDPQQDHDGSGIIGSSDEYFELYNPSDSPVDLTNWRLELIDATPETKTLEGIISPFSYSVILNPPGQQNVDGRIELYDPTNALINAITYGIWDDGNILDNLPDGGTSGIFNESLSRFPDGSDNWLKTRATPGTPNVPAPTTGIIFTTGLLSLLPKRKYCI